MDRIDSDFKSALHLCSFCFLNFPDTLSLERWRPELVYSFTLEGSEKPRFQLRGNQLGDGAFADMGSQKEGKVLRGKKTRLVLDIIVFIIQL